MGRPSRLRKLAFASAAAVLVLAALEGVAHLVEPRVRPPEASIPAPRPGGAGGFLKEAAEASRALHGIPMVEDETTRWALPPKQTVMSGSITCRINALGLRGPDLGPRAPDEDRLLTLGDSSVFGDGVAEGRVFSSVAAQQLTAAWGHPVVGVIGGVPGHDSSQALARLRQKGAAIEPTWVVIATLWSDVYKDNGRLRAPTPTVTAVRGPLRGFATYRVARYLLAPWLQRQKVGWIDSMAADVGSQDADARARVLLKDYLGNLRAMADEATRLGARPAFLALPAPIDLDPAGAPADVAEYREAMRRVAAERGAPYVDGPAWLREHGGTIGHFADQVHPNAYGHALVGDALAAALKAAPR